MSAKAARSRRAIDACTASGGLQPSHANGGLSSASLIRAIIAGLGVVVLSSLNGVAERAAGVLSFAVRLAIP